MPKWLGVASYPIGALLMTLFFIYLGFPYDLLVARFMERIEPSAGMGIEIGAVEQAKRYIDLGVRHFCIGWDRHLYNAAIAKLGEGMKKLLETL